MSSLKETLFYWNNNFPYDRYYRKKYNIGYNTEEHRKLCQIDIRMEFLEDAIFSEHEKEREKWKIRGEEYKKEGKWIRDQIPDSKVEEDLFFKMDPSDFDKGKDITFD